MQHPDADASDEHSGDDDDAADEVDVALSVHFDDEDAGTGDPVGSDPVEADTAVVDDAERPASAVAGGVDEDPQPPPAGEVRRFLDRRRPWLAGGSRRDRQRRLAALYWSGVYVLLMAGATSMVSFLVVRGYLWIFPGPTTTGAGVARRVVPWVLTVVFLVFAFYVTRRVRRVVLLGVLFLAPTLAFAFLDQAQSIAEWVVSWIPGTTTVYGLTAFGPVLAVALLGFDFVRWQLWVEFPQASCWNCGAKVRDERWIVCPYCDNDLQAQRDAGPGAAGSGGASADDAAAEAAATSD